jgi:hypothetical protein
MRDRIYHFLRAHADVGFFFSGGGLGAIIGGNWHLAFVEELIAALWFGLTIALGEREES